MVRQLADEPDRVGDAESVPFAYVDLTSQGVEGRKEPILHEDVVARERL